MVWNVHAALEARGIECSVQNCFAAGGVGELSPFESWPEVWVHDNEDAAIAKRLISEWQEGFYKQEGKEWVCANCKEENHSSFDVCWKCGGEKPY